MIYKRVHAEITEVLTGGERCTERALPYTEITHGKVQWMVTYPEQILILNTQSPVWHQQLLSLFKHYCKA
jgi:hypothetical protein